MCSLFSCYSECDLHSSTTDVAWEPVTQNHPLQPRRPESEPAFKQDPQVQTLHQWVSALAVPHPCPPQVTANHPLTPHPQVILMGSQGWEPQLRGC